MADLIANSVSVSDEQIHKMMDAEDKMYVVLKPALTNAMEKGEFSKLCCMTSFVVDIIVVFNSSSVITYAGIK